MLLIPCPNFDTEWSVQISLIAFMFQCALRKFLKFYYRCALMASDISVSLILNGHHALFVSDCRPRYCFMVEFASKIGSPAFSVLVRTYWGSIYLIN